MTHDRYFLDNVAGWILELDRGKGIPYQGNYSGWLEQKQARLAQEEKSESAHRRALAREMEWAGMSQKARQAKGKARLQRYEALLAEDANAQIDRLEIHIPAGGRLGDVVVEASGLEQGLRRQAPDRGSRLLAPARRHRRRDRPERRRQDDALPHDRRPGAARRAARCASATRSSSPTSTSRARRSTARRRCGRRSPTASTACSSASATSRRAQYVSSFNFRGSDQQKRVKDLSGGERNRLHLAKLLRSGANLLLLDEPTNDLDVDTLRALEDALERFAGCAVVISHDRWFLDRVATHLLVFEGDSHVRWFEGSFEEYERWRKDTLGEDAGPQAAALQAARAQLGLGSADRHSRRRPSPIEIDPGRAAGQPGGACGWLVVMARPSASAKRGCSPVPLVWMWWSWSSLWWRGQRRMRLSSSVLPPRATGDDVVGLQFAHRGAAGVLAVRRSGCAVRGAAA